MRKVFKIIIISLVTLTILCMLEHRLGGFRSYHNTRKLLEAIKSEDVNTVKELLEEGVDPNKTDVPPSKGWVFLETSPNRPLSIACNTGNLEIVKLLTEYGATAEPIDGTGWSPLREALFYFQPDDVEIVKILFENGASVEDGYWEDMVCFAAQMEPRIFDQTKSNGTVFIEGYDEMTAKGITEIIDILIIHGGSLDGTNGAGKPMLIVSVERENIYLTEYLLRAGCDASAKDVHGKTAYDYAIQSGNKDIIVLLENWSAAKSLDMDNRAICILFKF